MIHAERIRPLNDAPRAAGRYVLYWMQASQRAHDNHALEHAIRQANALKLPLLALFALADGYPAANERHYAFLLEGLAQTQQTLARRGVRLLVRRQPPPQAALQLADHAALLVVDAGYTRLQRTWRRQLARAAPCPVHQVESDVIVPVLAASAKQDYSAATFRPRILRRLDEFLVPLEPTGLRRDLLDEPLDSLDLADWPSLLADLPLDRTVRPVPSAPGGAAAARTLLAAFLREKLPDYASRRNDPSLDIQSHQSPYLHFGQISPLEIALAVRAAAPKHPQAAHAFLDQLIVRRELAVNFVHHCPRYASWLAVPSWARATLNAHRSDPRPTAYSLPDLEHARTHDPFWNAAQREMLLTGRMHNYMRMYWAKKILEWSPSPALAFRRALHLNNKYFLDGRGPNAFANVAWCFGLHDRPWSTRPLFGSVRYMNAAGLARKFDMDSYLRVIDALS